MSQIKVLHLLTKYNIFSKSWSRALMHTTNVRWASKNSTAGQSTLQRSTVKDRSDVSTDVRPLGEKIKENTKTASYTAIIIAGVGVTGLMFYAIFRELFSSTSPNNVYSEALERVKEDNRVQDAIGAPIKGYGEESRRGRRQHVAHSTYERNGIPHMRMQFYIQGIRNKATVHLESRKTSAGDVEYRYLFVQLDHYPHTTIILEDNRYKDDLVVRDTTAGPLSKSGVELATFHNK